MASSAGPESPWQHAIGFADRLAIINKIAASLEPALTRPEAVQRAQNIETECLGSAFSQDEYDRLWTARLNELASTAQRNPSLQDENDPFAHLTIDTPPTSLGSYHSAVPFESGLFSTIYKAAPAPTTPEGPSTLVALKVTNPSSMGAPHDSHKEARLLRLLSRQPHILPCLESFTIPPSTFVIVTPYLPYTLSHLLTTSIPINIPQILHDIFSGLSTLHGKDIIHRDIKPSNILFAHPGGSAYISDFGIAWALDDPGSEPRNQKITDVGTTCYRAPELLFGYRRYGNGIDLWATGCLLAECLHPTHEQFFDSGDLGSELKLVSSIFQKLGTPTEKSWPESSQLPDFGKISFFEFPPNPWATLMPYTTEPSRDLVSKLLVYESGNRIGAAEALKHPFLKSCSSRVS